MIIELPGLTYSWCKQSSAVTDPVDVYHTQKTAPNSNLLMSSVWKNNNVDIKPDTTNHAYTSINTYKFGYITAATH